MCKSLEIQLKEAQEKIARMDTCYSAAADVYVKEVAAHQAVTGDRVRFSDSLKSDIITIRHEIAHGTQHESLDAVDRLLDKFFDYKAAENCQTVCPDCDGSGRIKVGEHIAGPITRGCSRCEGTGVCDH